MRHLRDPRRLRKTDVTLTTLGATRLRVVPLRLSEANAAVARWHRHHRPVRFHFFSIGAVRDGELVGAAIVFKPAARHYDPRAVAEVARLASDGTPHVCSMLYAAAARACAAMGYQTIQTYILKHEPGTSLRASGWTFADHVTDSHRKRRGAAERAADPKQRWIKELSR